MSQTAHNFTKPVQLCLCLCQTYRLERGIDALSISPLPLPPLPPTPSPRLSSSSSRALQPPALPTFPSYRTVLCPNRQEHVFLPTDSHFRPAGTAPPAPPTVTAAMHLPAFLPPVALPRVGRISTTSTFARSAPAIFARSAARPTFSPRLAPRMRAPSPLDSDTSWVSSIPSTPIFSSRAAAADLDAPGSGVEASPSLEGGAGGGGAGLGPPRGRPRPDKPSSGDDDATGAAAAVASGGGWARRVQADKDFPFKVLMELTVGLGLAASGMVAARGARIWDELDFALCDVAVGATLNFLLVYLLSPVAGAKVGRVAALPANLFAVGNYGAAERLAGFVWKGVLFAACGFAGSLVGTGASMGLVKVRTLVRERKGGEEKVEHPLPNIFVNSAAWAGFMFLSANPRYQALAGVERLLFSRAPVAVAKAGSAAARTANNVIGGAMWVIWARYLGIQEEAK